MQRTESQAMFATWAPDSSRWSAWAKPVLFTYPTPLAFSILPPPELAAERAPSPGDGVAVVVDMPGAQSVACGMVLAERGFRPVPLFNTTTGPGTNIVDVAAVLSGLIDATDRLAALAIRDDAPPAFLIDSARIDGKPTPTAYDNRWMVFPQDFPSARSLGAAGLGSVVVIRRPGEAVKPDLRAVLRYWTREGLRVQSLDPATGVKTALDYDTSLLSVIGDGISSWMTGLRRNSTGGFGGVVPMPSATGGGFA